MVGLGVDFGDVADYVADNDLGTAVGLWALHRRGFRGRLVLASSMVVYGEGALPLRRRTARSGRATPAEPTSRPAASSRRAPTCGAPLAPALVTEDAPPDPRNVYAATKLHQEHLCAAFGREHGRARHRAALPQRLRAADAARHALRRRGQPSSAARSSRARRRTVFEDGGQRRDFVHVDDVARANVAALTGREPYDGALNVASGQPRTILEMASRPRRRRRPRPSPRGDRRLPPRRRAPRRGQPGPGDGVDRLRRPEGSGCRPEGVCPRPTPPTPARAPDRLNS